MLEMPMGVRSTSVGRTRKSLTTFIGQFTTEDNSLWVLLFLCFFVDVLAVKLQGLKACQESARISPIPRPDGILQALVSDPVRLRVAQGKEASSGHARC